MKNVMKVVMGAIAFVCACGANGAAIRRSPACDDLVAVAKGELENLGEESKGDCGRVSGIGEATQKSGTVSPIREDEGDFWYSPTSDSSEETSSEAFEHVDPLGKFISRRGISRGENTLKECNGEKESRLQRKN